MKKKIRSNFHFFNRFMLTE